MSTKKSDEIQRTFELLCENYNEENFKKFYEVYNPVMRKSISYRIYKNKIMFNDNSTDIKNDIASMVWEKIIKNHDKYIDSYRAFTWLASIVKHEFYNWCNKELNLKKFKTNYKKRWADTSLTSLNTGLNSYRNNGNEPYQHNSDSYYAQEDRRLKSDFQNKVINEIERLPEKYSGIMYDRIVEEKSYNDLVDKYDLPMQTIKNRIFAAKEKLRNKLENEYKEIFY